MIKTHIFSKPHKNARLSFDELYEDISWDWQHKAEDLQLRRWKTLRQSSKKGYHATR